MFNLVDKFLDGTFLVDDQFAIFDTHRTTTSGESANKDHFLGVLADVDESTSAGQFWSKLANVEVAFFVSLG